MDKKYPVYRWLALIYLVVGILSAIFGYKIMKQEHMFILDIRTINSIGILIALLLWFGKEWGRKLAIGLGGYNLISLIIQLYLVFYDYLKDIPSISQEHNVSLIEEITTIADNVEFVLIISALLALFQMWILWILIDKKESFH